METDETWDHVTAGRFHEKLSLTWTDPGWMFEWRRLMRAVPSVNDIKH